MIETPNDTIPVTLTNVNDGLRVETPGLDRLADDATINGNPISIPVGDTVEIGVDGLVFSPTGTAELTIHE